MADANADTDDFSSGEYIISEDVIDQGVPITRQRLWGMKTANIDDEPLIVQLTFWR